MPNVPIPGWGSGEGQWGGCRLVPRLRAADHTHMTLKIPPMRGRAPREGSPARHLGTPGPQPIRSIARVVAARRVRDLGLILSDQARLVLTRRYDAFATDRAYASAPHGWLGPLGRAADLRVLRLPVHVALRERIENVVGALDALVRVAAREADPVRVISVPCGLARDLMAAAVRLGPGVSAAWTGVDFDQRGDVLPEAVRRADRVHVPIQFVRGDVFDPQLRTQLAARAPFHIVSCIGMTAWIDRAETEDLTRLFGELLAPGGWLLIDSWREGADGELGRVLHLPTNYYEADDFHPVLERCGFNVEDRRATSGWVNTLWIARRR